MAISPGQRIERVAEEYQISLHYIELTEERIYVRTKEHGIQVIPISILDSLSDFQLAKRLTSS